MSIDEVTIAEALAEVQAVYANQFVIGSANMTGVAQNILMAMTLLEIRRLRVDQLKVAAALGVAT